MIFSAKCQFFMDQNCENASQGITLSLQHPINAVLSSLFMDRMGSFTNRKILDSRLETLENFYFFLEFLEKKILKKSGRSTALAD